MAVIVDAVMERYEEEKVDTLGAQFWLICEQVGGFAAGMADTTLASKRRR